MEKQAKPTVLILCTGNSCRSHMAEGILRSVAGDVLDVQSAGSDPAGYVHPLAIRTMADIGIDTAVLKYPYAVYRPGLVNRAATIPRLTSGDDGQTIYPFDWPKGIEESSLSRGGYCMCY
mgnify:CR=1 FL=1